MSSSNNQHKLNNFTSFLLGGITGGILTLLFTPYSGKEFRGKINESANDLAKYAKKKEEEIVDKAKKVSDDMIVKAIQVAALADKYASGMLDISAERIETEINSLKAAINAAVKAYKGNNGSAFIVMPRIDIAENIFSDYDNVVLPKSEGMKRRLSLKTKYKS